MAGCASPLISQVSLTQSTISPNGDGVDDFTFIEYSLEAKAQVSIDFAAANGEIYSFRRHEPRSPGRYRARFDGSYIPDPARAEARVLPSGSYTYIVTAQEEGTNRRQEVRGSLTLVNSDTRPPGLDDVIVYPETISPNGDAVDDEALISYRLTKESLVSIFISDGAGRRYFLEEENQKSAAPHSHRWNGTAAGNLLPNGSYTLSLRARDKAGNVTEYLVPVTISGGGTPKLEIAAVRFTPPTLPLGGALKVEIEVQNVGDITLRTMGPPPGTAYTTNMNFNSFHAGNDPLAPPLYYEQAGYWRVGVSWDTADRPYPIRWGMGRDLAPGEKTTITGTVQILVDRTRQVRFWAAVIQEGVGFGEQVGLKSILISY